MTKKIRFKRIPKIQKEITKYINKRPNKQKKVLYFKGNVIGGEDK